MNKENNTSISICILRLSAIGDITHIIPIVSTLQKYYKKCDITWIIGKTEYQLVKTLDNINYIVIDKNKTLDSIIGMHKYLKEEKFDVVFHMQKSLRSKILGRMIDGKINVTFNDINTNNNHVLDNFFAFLEKINIQKKELIDELKTIDEKKFDFDTRKNLENQIAETKLLKEKREVQIRIALIQERINSIWKKPSLINRTIQAEFIINLAPSGEILSFDLISSSGEKVFDDSALAALSKIYFITEVIGLERKYFERNFRSFNLVFKSKNQ